MECSSTSTAKSFCEIIFVLPIYLIRFLLLPLMLQHRSEGCPLLTLSPCCLTSLVAPHSHTSWIFSLLCSAFASAFIKISPYFCCSVSLWFSAFMSFKCSLFLSTGNVWSASLVSFVIHVQTAVYTGQVQEKLNSSICWKQLCTCSSQWDENLCHVLGTPCNKVRVLHPHFSNPWVSVRITSIFVLWTADTSSHIN